MGLVVLLVIWVWFFVGDWFCRRSVFLWLLGFVLIWRLLCVLHVWLLRKCKKRNKNIDFYYFLGNEWFEEEHEQFWGSEEEHEQLRKEHKEHDKGMIFQQNNKKKKQWWKEKLMKRMGGIETEKYMRKKKKIKKRSGLVFLFKKLLDHNSCEFFIFNYVFIFFI